MIHKISTVDDDDVLKCYQCENCSTVTNEDLKDCKADNDICQIIYKHGNVSRHCLDDTGEFEYKCGDGQCFCEPYKTGKQMPCNDNTMFDDLCANDNTFKAQFSAVCPDPPVPNQPVSIIIIIVVVVVVVIKKRGSQSENISPNQGKTGQDIEKE